MIVIKSVFPGPTSSNVTWELVRNADLGPQSSPANEEIPGLRSNNTCVLITEEIGIYTVNLETHWIAKAVSSILILRYFGSLQIDVNN